MQISLSQAVHLRGIIQGVISDLNRERLDVAFVDAEKGEQFDKPSKSVEEVDKELNEAREHFRQLDVLMAEENLGKNIEWDDKMITTTEAIELAKQMRYDVSNLKHHFASAKKQENISNHYYDGTRMTRHAMFDVENMKKRVKKQERMVNRLSQIIEETNHLTKFEFEPADNYI